MAYLNFNKMHEPVSFGGRECMPSVDEELKLRLQQINTYNAEAKGVIASAFPKDEKYVRNFLDNMSDLDVQELHVYLIGGINLVEKMRKSLDDMLAKEVNNG